MNAQFEGHAEEIIDAMQEAVITALEAVGIQAESYAKKKPLPTQADCATAFRTRWMHADRRSTSAHRLNTAHMSNSAQGSIMRAVGKRRGRIRMQKEIGIGRAATKRSRFLRPRSKTTSRHTKTS